MEFATFNKTKFTLEKIGFQISISMERHIKAFLESVKVEDQMKNAA